jgi:hypothetical protein
MMEFLIIFGAGMLIGFFIVLAGPAAHEAIGPRGAGDQGRVAQKYP